MYEEEEKQRSRIRRIREVESKDLELDGVFAEAADEMRKVK